jgi:hypothetical protein
MEHVSLLVDLGVAMLLMSIVTIIHGTGISLMDQLFRTESRDFWKLPLVTREIGVMVPMALCLLVLHTIEIFVFALFYIAAEDANGVREALYHSALAYTTMGITEGSPTKWALVTAFEGLVGFLMIGWSSAVFVTDMERVLRRHPTKPE